MTVQNDIMQRPHVLDLYLVLGALIPDGWRRSISFTSYNHPSLSKISTLEREPLSLHPFHKFYVLFPASVFRRFSVSR